ncbi:MAG: NUDIX hydrolase [Pelagimonas sp.]|uniref:NUDIX hydrolase n=1 Tax=Pelagimonas sp. TaxID=2073170 RepID=UPI003D6C682A
MTNPHDIGPFMYDDARERSEIDRLRAFVQANSGASFSRDPCIGGHVTGSAFVLSPDRTATLLTHHAKLDRWLQLGGHCDGLFDVQFVALKEAYEESGLPKLTLLSPDVFDLDIHCIPANAKEPEHLHYDVRYLLQSSQWEFETSVESKALRWVPLGDLPNFSQSESVLRLGRKALEFLASRSEITSRSGQTAFGS